MSVVASMVCFAAVPASAQGGGSHWVADVSFTPKWTSHDRLAENLLNWTAPLEGTEFTIGVGRGSTLGGDWSVSYVHKPFEDTTTEESDTSCSGPFCSTFTQRNTLSGVYLRGVEFNWHRPFVTIARRVQIGVNVGGGIAVPKGSIVSSFEFGTVFTNPVNGQVTRTTDSDTETLPAKDELYPYVPLIKAEVAAALIVAPAFKIKFAGGLNSPSAPSLRVGAVVLFGAR